MFEKNKNYVLNFLSTQLIQPLIYGKCVFVFVLNFSSFKIKSYTFSNLNNRKIDYHSFKNGLSDEKTTNACENLSIRFFSQVLKKTYTPKTFNAIA